MNRSLLDTAGEMLVVSQFTILGDLAARVAARRRRRGAVNTLYEYFI